MPAPVPRNPEIVLECYRLWRFENLSVRKVAEKMGIPKTTAQDYIRAGREREGWMPDWSTAEIRGDLDALHAEIAKTGIPRLLKAESDRDWSAVANVLLALSKRISELHGANMPGRLQVEQVGGEGTNMDDPIFAGVRDLMRRNEEDRENYRNGGPGVIEGSKRV